MDVEAARKSMRAELQKLYDELGDDHGIQRVALLFQYDKEFIGSEKALDLDRLIPLEYLKLDIPQREEALDLMTDEEQVRLASLIHKVQADNEARAIREERARRLDKRKAHEPAPKTKQQKIKLRRKRQRKARKMTKARRH